MFRRSVKHVDDIVLECLRENGLETPLLQARLLNSWESVAGELVARYTEEKFIRNQTLYVKISSPALRSDLSMKLSELTEKLNKEVGSHLIAEIRIY
ncbi:MAG: DUF721 domain-containing protein [Prevotella sp.]|nr:DUF721 domain-containing protein [Prevotella sp.]